jgi:prolyl-tRNA editing enzyme YbaK/EbsC (Cys-tRNA(Pro) deacylase)
MSAKIELLHPLVVDAIKKHGLDVEVLECDPSLADTAAFCESYGIPPERTCNAILVVGKSDPLTYVCCVVLATCKVDVNKTVSALLGIKRCSFASGEQTVEKTDMQIGGVTPVGIESMPIYIDSAVAERETVLLGGGNRSSKLVLKPSEFNKLPNAQFIAGLGIPR